MVERAGRYQHAVPRFYRVLNAIHPDHALTPGDEGLVLPGVRVMGAGLPGLMVVIKRDYGRNPVFRAEDRVAVVSRILYYGFQ